MDRLHRPGHHVVEHQPPTGPQDPGDLAVEPGLMGDVHGRVLGPDQVETGVREGQGGAVAADEIDPLGEPDPGGQVPGRPAVDHGEIQAGDPAAESLGQQARRPADSRAQVEHPGLGLEPGVVGQLHRGQVAARL